MTVAGKLAVADHALRKILTAYDSGSFRALDKAVAEARDVHVDISKWAGRPHTRTLILSTQLTGTEG